MKIVIKCLLIIIIPMSLFCACATEQTDKHWKSHIETIVEIEENNLLEMWDICSKNEITGITIAKHEESKDTRYFKINLNNTTYTVAFENKPGIIDETKLQLNRLCEIYEALSKNYKILDMSCYYLADSKNNYMIFGLADTTFYSYSLEYYPPKSAKPEDVYMKEFHTHIKDGFYMKLYTPGY